MLKRFNCNLYNIYNGNIMIILYVLLMMCLLSVVIIYGPPSEINQWWHYKL